MTTQAKYQTPIDGAKYITLFADASYDYHTKIAGWACWIKHDSPAKTVRISGTATAIASSNNAEMLALSKGIDHIIANIPLKGKVVVIQSDCTGALAKIEALYKADLPSARYKHVKGHQGTNTPRSSVNTWCDEEARRLMRIERSKHEQATHGADSA